ncbi:MAG: NAD(P)H-dependent oxidoreductase [Ignavibacteriae bacterium]|nr:NAD(P)H-dependent oxidoreductase [Ignavibacteriota bacterium]
MGNFPIKILAFSGSLRRDSYNKQLVDIASEGARKAGAEVTIIELRDYPMPFYDGDLQEHEGFPEGAGKFRQLMVEHHGFLIASPEYNMSMTAALKNAIDWASRAASGEAARIAFKGKVAALMTTSTGYFGGIRGLSHLRLVLESCGTMVLPEQIAVPKASGAFSLEGRLSDGKQHDTVEKLGANVAILLKKLHS